ncbi:hypothetical protein [Streptomyces sp. NBC_01718]|uniref:hypothetical protein n=1 Tax=Streptomyces sp. NBC_01718 TaxID=2975919 RepID=UPI00352F4DEB
MNTSPMDPPTPDGPGATPPSHRARRGFSRRAFVGGAAASAAAAGIALAAGGLTPASATAPRQMPKGFGSVAAAPHLPAGFKQMFTSRLVQAGRRAAAARGHRR